MRRKVHKSTRDEAKKVSGRRQYSPHREVMTIDDYDDSHPIYLDITRRHSS